MNQSKGYPRCVLSHSLFDGAGLLRPDYERVDWAATSLGPASSWAPSLRGTLALALATRFPVTLLWGPDLVLLYNEAYVPLIGEITRGTDVATAVATATEKINSITGCNG